VANFNRVILAGNLTRDPELSYTAGNTAICKFGMAVNRKWRDKDGNNKEDVCFVDLTAFGRQGETINQYMGKGRSILVEGRLNFRQWTDKDNRKCSKLDVVVENFTFLGDRGQAGGGGGGGGERSGPAPRQQAGRQSAPPPSDEPMDEPPPQEEGDIPF
jgi:single-strand DNA-binding protein